MTHFSRDWTNPYIGCCQIISKSTHDGATLSVCRFANEMDRSWIGTTAASGNRKITIDIKSDCQDTTAKSTRCTIKISKSTTHTTVEKTVFIRICIIQKKCHTVCTSTTPYIDGKVNGNTISSIKGQLRTSSTHSTIHEGSQS